MDRLCGRPGCSEPASVAYGMRAEDLVFWIDVLPDATDGVGGVLCRRHADSMVVPRGWTLDDLRDPDLHLFRPPPPSPAAARPARRRSRRVDWGEQLALAAVREGVDESADEPIAADELVAAHVAPEEPWREAWSPSFDEADDLDGLLHARSPLLARAFRTVDRSDGSGPSSRPGQV